MLKLAEESHDTATACPILEKVCALLTEATNIPVHTKHSTGAPGVWDDMLIIGRETWRFPGDSFYWSLLATTRAMARQLALAINPPPDEDEGDSFLPAGMAYNPYTGKFEEA